ncbi:MAG: hypothetical protein AABY13_02610, partial [Nanoarchaeota archaeon]
GARRLLRRRRAFVERKLVHSICAFAFTGTWDLDVAGVFKQTVQDIPLKSQAFLYPAERRFISYNPITRPSGLPTFTYHFGVGLVAGQDLRYQLELKCSNNLRCEPRDGFENGKCDCTGRTEQRILVGAPELGSGSLKKNDILNTEVFYTIQGGDPASAVRYDTAILSWEALDPGSGQVTRDKKEIPIHLIGSRPPNFCRFDPIGLAFRCDIGIGDYTGARFIPPIIASYPQAQDAFIINDEMTFKVPVLLQYPQSLKDQAACIGACPYTKFINYEVKNQLGQPIIELRKPDEVGRSSQLRVEKNGDDTLTIRLNTGGSRRIKKSDFGFTSTAASPVRFVDSESARFTTPRPTSPLQIGVILVVTKTAAGSYKWELFDTVNDGEKAGSTESSYIERAPDKESSGQWGWYRKGAARPEGSGQLVQGDTVTTKNPEITFKVPPSFDLKRPAEYYLPATPITGAIDDICQKLGTTPAKWKVTFKMFDSTQVAGGTAYEYNPAQPTVDPSSGEVQEQTVEFNVLCSDKYVGGGGAIRECPPNSALQLTGTQCFCGGPAELAQARETLKTDPQAPILNCGEGAPVQPGGLYCVYRDEANPSAGRYCSNTPGSGSVTTGGQTFAPAKVTYSSKA